MTNHLNPRSNNVICDYLFPVNRKDKQEIHVASTDLGSTFKLKNLSKLISQSLRLVIMSNGVYTITKVVKENKYRLHQISVKGNCYFPMRFK